MAEHKEGKSAESGIGRAAWRAGREKNLLAEQSALVDENDLAIATRLVELFAKHSHLADPYSFPKGSKEHLSRRNFRSACFRWLKPGNLSGRKKEHRVITRDQDRQAVEACGIRTLRNQKKKVLPFGSGLVVMTAQPSLSHVTVTEEEPGSSFPDEGDNHHPNPAPAQCSSEPKPPIIQDKYKPNKRARKRAKQKARKSMQGPEGLFVSPSPSILAPPSPQSASSELPPTKETASSPSPSSTPQTAASSRPVPSEEALAQGESSVGGEEDRKVEAGQNLQNVSGDDERPTSAPSLPSPLPQSPSPDGPQLLAKPVTCYVCKNHFMILHHFYDRMCPKCAALNFSKRLQTADLSGKVALLTGARIKIGFEIGLMLLRAGAVLIGTTRFPRDALCRYATEADFGDWKDRLELYPLDLRILPQIEVFVHYITSRHHRLDMIINNAAQTIRRPPAFYRSLMRLETTPLAQLEGELPEALRTSDLAERIQTFMPTSAPPLDVQAEPSEPTLTLQAAKSKKSIKGKNGRKKGKRGKKSRRNNKIMLSPTDKNTAEGTVATTGAVGGLLAMSLLGGGSGVPSPAVLSQVAMVPEDVQSAEQNERDFPIGDTDENNQQLDLRAKNTWVLPLEDVSTVEATEVHLINALAPFILNSKFKRLMASSGSPTWIVNVSSMEGRFASYKEAVHPHTNMAKAALNMMTCTSAKDYAMSKIFMNSVDTGWVTEENPESIAAKKRACGGFGPPLDEIDGAARVLDPIFTSIHTNVYEFGKFYKDYAHSPWEYNAASRKASQQPRTSKAAF